MAWEKEDLGALCGNSPQAVEMQKAWKLDYAYTHVHVHVYTCLKYGATKYSGMIS